MKKISVIVSIAISCLGSLILTSTADAEVRTYGNCSVYGGHGQSNPGGFSETSTTDPSNCGTAYATAMICDNFGNQCYFQPTGSGYVYAYSGDNRGRLEHAYHQTDNSPQWVSI
jgi:hypothetical protein